MMIRPNFSKFMLVALLASASPLTFAMEPLEQALRECRICTDDKPEAEFTTLTCGHQGGCNTCRWDMLKDALKARTAAEMRVALRCTHSSPNPDNIEQPIRCPYEINEVDIRLITGSEAVVTQYSDKLFEEILNTDPFIRRCPTRDCQNGYSLPRPTLRGSVYDWMFGMRAVQCSSCNQEYCPDCRAPHSRFALCPLIENNGIINNNNLLNNNNNNAAAIQADILERQARALNDWFEGNNAKPCPSCKGIIQKTDGCIHMSHKKADRGCGHEFCWDCLIPWNEHNGYVCRQEDLARVGAHRVAFMNQCVEAARYVLNSPIGRHIRDRRVIFVLLMVTITGTVGWKMYKIVKPDNN